MKYFTLIFSILFATLFAKAACSEETFPIVSANGFSCSQNDGMVSCRGSFPDNPSPVLEATGYNVVWLRSEYSDHRYTFYSDSGCLCRADFKENGEVKTQECTARFGEKKSFKGGRSTYEWCKKK